MFRSKEDILHDIDATLDRLLQNADVLERISDSPLYSTEKEALEKMQESLLAHLMNMDAMLSSESIPKKSTRELEKLKTKVAIVEKRNAPLIQEVETRITRQSRSQLRKTLLHSNATV